MAHTYREVKRTVVRDRDDVDLVEPDIADRGTHIAARIVSMIGGIIMALLAMRFILSLLGANRGAPFADFVYSTSYPFVAPFFGLFNYQPQFGAARFEFETLIAIGFWAFVTWVIMSLINIGTRD